MLQVAKLRNRRSHRASSWDTTGRNTDAWFLSPGESRVLADLEGPAAITHIWIASGHLRECLLRFTWDNSPQPSIVCPLGDFFGLGHGMLNSYQSYFFSASSNQSHTFAGSAGCGFNCYIPMPFKSHAKVELINESDEIHSIWFYIDYESMALDELAGLGYLHAEFRRANPFGGWGHAIDVNTPQADIANKERLAWDNNYVILDTKGRGHYVGCNLSVANFKGQWWGEGDDMIWADGYKWPPDLHGTGSEDYLCHAWGMQNNAFLRSGTSIDETASGGYCTSYVQHVENPVRFEREIKVTIEGGHGNHLANDISSVAYWYAQTPTSVQLPPPVEKRLPVLRDNAGNWLHDPARQCPGKKIDLTPDMEERCTEWGLLHPESGITLGCWHSPAIEKWQASRLMPKNVAVESAPRLSLRDDAGWRSVAASSKAGWFVNVHHLFKADADGIVYLAARFRVEQAGEWEALLGHDGGVRVFSDGAPAFTCGELKNPAAPARSKFKLAWAAGEHELVIALDTAAGKGWGIYFSFMIPEDKRNAAAQPSFPAVI